MAFPVVENIVTRNFPTAATSHSIQLNATINPGDLLLIFLVIDGVPSVSLSPTYWADHVLGSDSNGTAARFYVLARIADGTEDGTNVVVTLDASQELAAMVVRISGWQGTLPDGVVISSDVSGTSVSPNPGAASLVGAAEDVLWIACYGADDDDAVSAYPTNYSGNNTFMVATNAVSGALGTRNLNATTDNPGAFTIAASEEWMSWTIGVRPGVAVPVISSITPDEVQDGDTGVVIAGANFLSPQSTGKVEISDNIVYASGTKVQQVETAWAANSITFTIESGSLGAGTRYVWVTNSSGQISAGFPITIRPEVTNVSPTSVEDGQTGVVITGTSFKGTQGTSKVELSDNAVYGVGILVEQIETAWADTSITFTVDAGDIQAGPIWLFVTVNPTSDGFAMTLTESPFPLPFVFPEGPRRLGIEVYAVDGIENSAAPIGVITDIISADTEEAISLIGSWSATVPLNAENVNYLSMAREVYIIRESEGRVFRGTIDHREISIFDDKEVVIISGASYGEKLTRGSTYRGIYLDEETAQDSADTIIAGTGWTALLTGSNFQDISTRFDNVSPYAAMLDFAKFQKAYLRETATLLELEIKNSHTPTGIRLIPVLYATPEMAENPLMALYNSKKRQVDSSDLWNRIVPEGKADGDKIFDLQGSTRTTPYAIQSLLVTPPRVTNTVRVPETFGLFEEGIEIVGENRLLVVFIGVGTVAQEVIAVKAGGRLMVERMALNASNFNYYCFTLTNPAKGYNAIEALFTDPDVDSLAVMMAIALSDVDQVDPIRQVLSQTATATSSSLAPSSAVGDLVMDGLHFAAASTAGVVTPGAGQTAIITSIGAEDDIVSIEQAGTPTTTMSMSWPNSSEFAHIALSIKPALAWYIEDAASIAAYGLRVKHLSQGDRVPPQVLNLVPYIDTMYDEAVDFLIKSKDPLLSYDVQILGLPRKMDTWNIGDLFTLQEDTDDISLVCVKRHASYDSDGIRTWDLELSTIAKLRHSIAEAFAEVVKKLDILQYRQV